MRGVDKRDKRGVVCGVCRTDAEPLHEADHHHAQRDGGDRRVLEHVLAQEKTERQREGTNHTTAVTAV